jgi:hypothetical protein
LKMSEKLLLAILTNHFAQVQKQIISATDAGAAATPEPSFSPAQQAQAAISSLEQKGYLIKQNSDYQITFVKKGDSLLVNDKVPDKELLTIIYQ